MSLSLGSEKEANAEEKEADTEKHQTLSPDAPVSASRYLLPSMLPQGDSVFFKDSTFFAREGAQLPTPAEVRQAAGAAYIHGRPQPPPVLFPSLNLLVKYGSEITAAEGQCLWAIRRFLPSVPVPEVYGWCHDDPETFIYMELVDGITLQEGWPDLDVEERLGICTQLHPMLRDLRQLRQDPGHRFVGDINRQSLHDVIFNFEEPAGPFQDVKSFYDYFSTMTRRKRQGWEDMPVDPMRYGLLDDVPIVFTHNDLHRSNIMMSKLDSGPLRILAIIDWHQSGWYPAPWEFFKTRVTCKEKDAWEVDYIFEFLQSHQGNINWEYFIHCLGAV